MGLSEICSRPTRTPLSLTIVTGVQAYATNGEGPPKGLLVLRRLHITSGMPYCNVRAGSLQARLC